MEDNLSAVDRYLSQPGLASNAGEGSLSDLSEALKLGGSSYEEKKESLSNAGFVLDSSLVRPAGYEAYTMNLGHGLKIGVDLSTSKRAKRDVAIKWDPLPYLVGKGSDWANLAKGGAAFIAGAVCTPLGWLGQAACGTITNFILNGLGDTSKIDNANECYWMKNFNNPPEKVDSKECN